MPIIYSSILNYDNRYNYFNRLSSSGAFQLCAVLFLINCPFGCSAPGGRRDRYTGVSAPITEERTGKKGKNVYNY